MNRFRQVTEISLERVGIRVKGTGIFVQGPFDKHLLEPDTTFESGFMIDLCHATEAERKYIEVLLSGKRPM